MRRSQIVRGGLHTSLTDLRLRKNYRSSHARWQQEICSGPALFVVGRDKAKLSYFWRHAYAGDVYNMLFRLDPDKMVARAYEWRETGLRSFSEASIALAQGFSRAVVRDVPAPGTSPG